MKMKDPRLKLVNLWSCLECLASYKNEDSILENVLELAVPLIEWRRPSKIIGYAAISLRLWLKKNPELSELMPPEITIPNESISPMKLLHFFSNNPTNDSLLKVVDSHPLLKKSN